MEISVELATQEEWMQCQRQSQQSEVNRWLMQTFMAARAPITRTSGSRKFFMGLDTCCASRTQLVGAAHLSRASTKSKSAASSVKSRSFFWWMLALSLMALALR